MSKKLAVKKPVVPAMFSKNPPTTTSTEDTATSKENKSKDDRLVPWVEK